MNAIHPAADTLTIVAPLGIRFRDESTGEFITEGLNVAVYKPERPATRTQAVANPSGIYVVHHAPGLLDVEHGRGDARFWDEVPRQRFVVAVTDAASRFQPFQIDVQLPERGVLNWPDSFPTSLPEPTPSLPLYSSAMRRVPPGMAVLRADLWDATNDRPAAWSVIEAYIDSQLVGRSIADDGGRIALIFPQPSPRPFTAFSPSASGSPTASTGPPLMEQTWSIELRALYGPVSSPPSLPGELLPEKQLPDLRVLLSQPEATLWADSEHTAPLHAVTLSYGRELILKSTLSLSLSRARQSVLFITPAVSPP